MAELFNIESDVVFDIGLTANRGDAASHFGVARELATVLNLPFNVHTSDILSTADTINLSIELKDEDACPRYSGLILDNIQVTESPEWLKNRLSSIGLKSINNIVDVTNFILHETGQPLHAFDYSKISGETIRIQRAVTGDKFVTLDGVERELKGHELMISDASEPMCMAGIYGGAKSGVSETTTKIFLESAYFSPDVVRKGAKAHGISTDSSFRFERGTDPEMTITALKRAAAILAEVSGARVVGQLIDHYPSPLEPFVVDLKRSNIKRIIGIDIPAETLKQILTGLGITILSDNESGFLLSVPRFKSDVSREIDVIEELIRIYGFKHIPLERNMRMSLRYEKDSPLRKAELLISEILRGNGFREIMTNSLSSDKNYAETSELVYLSNPLSAEMNVLRQSMLYSALEAVAYNKNRKQSNTRFFEFGKIYFQKEKGFKETDQLLILASGMQTNESWETASKAVDYYYIRSIVNKVYDAFHVPAEKFEIAEVDAKTLQKFGIKDQVFYAVLDWTKVAKTQKPFALKAIPQFPAVRRDLSLVVDQPIHFENIQEIIKKQNNALISGVNVFDIYEGKPLEAGKKSISISIDLYDANKTLSDQDIDPVMDKLIKQFETDINAIIRK